MKCMFALKDSAEHGKKETASYDAMILLTGSARHARLVS